MFARRRFWDRNPPQPPAAVGNRPQPSATVRDDEVAVAVPMASSAKMFTFGNFNRRVASFQVAGVALCDIPTCFITCRKSFCVTWRNTFASFSEDEVHFSGQAQHFGELHRHFAWQVWQFRRVVLRAFFANRSVRAARSGDNVQIPWQEWHFVTCDENCRKPLRKHRF